MSKNYTVVTLALLLLLPIGFLSDADAQVSISGIVNAYTRVTAMTQPVCGCDPACVHTITVTDASAFEVGDRALIIQMKGATINTANAAGSGNVTAINNAGNYEFFIVGSIAGNVLTPRYPLIRPYTVAGMVQVVRIPSYPQVTITDTVKALPWDETAGIGGVVALYARRITMNAPIWVLGQGYQGQQMAVNGTPDDCSINPTTQFVLPNTDNSSWDKGQGIVVDNAATNRGRAPRANGGGSGVSGDTGGGGGSNYGTGGVGGRRWCDVGGALAGGEGGVTLAPFISDDRVYLGGAGGPGWVSTDNPSTAANGGGIVIIFSDTVDGNGFEINAEGTAPVAVNPVGNPDGGGGGGAGGTVVLKVKTFQGNLDVDLGGGDGQDLNTNIYHGPGGGGGGGTLLYSLAVLPATVTISVAGGIGGQHLDGFRNNSGDGSAGGTFSLYVPIQNPNYLMAFDGDDILAECDIDDDNDGVPDIAEAYTRDHDNDGTPDYNDPDFCAATFNGISGWSCATSGLPDPSADMDGDGRRNFEDPDFPYCGGLINGGVCRNMDADGDGNPNHTDLDADNDGIPDIIEAGGIDTNGDGFIDNNVDTDEDGLVDDYDTDDTDGPTGTTPCGTLACLQTSSLSVLNDANADGTVDRLNDTDGDRIPNYLDLDADNDGIADIVEMGGTDANGDGYVDVFNPATGALNQDLNRDGFTSVYQHTVCHQEPSSTNRTVGISAHNGAGGGTDNPDNALGIPDANFAELFNTGDVFVFQLPVIAQSFNFRVLNQAGGVADGTLEASLNGTTFGAPFAFNVPVNAAIQNITVNVTGGARFFRYTRTDGDNIQLHGVTATYIRDTLTTICVTGTPIAITGPDVNGDHLMDSLAAGDSDKDDVPNFLDLDSDNDGIADLAEAGGTDTNGDGVLDNFNRTTGVFSGAGDGDRDGFYNGYDNDTDNNGTTGDANPLVTTSTDANGDGRPESYVSGDADGDRYLNIWDRDSDNDGIPDLVEAGGTDTDGNGVVDGFNPNTGAFTGVGDTDRDGFYNLFDGDTDNNGTASQGNPLVFTGADADNNGRPDSYATGDADGDRIQNYLDLDSDNDGIQDIVESGGTDTNGDGYVDVYNRATGVLGQDLNTDGFTSVYQGLVCFKTASVAPATTHATAHGPGNVSVTNPNNALGLPLAADFCLLNSNGDILTLQMGLTIPVGSTITLFISNPSGNQANTNVSFSTDGTTFTNVTASNIPAANVAMTAYNFVVPINTVAIRIIRTDNDDINVHGASTTLPTTTFTETCVTGNPIGQTGADTNADGKPESYTSADRDGDRIPGYLDLDSDNDGIADISEVGGTDANGDGVLDDFNRTTGVFSGAGDADGDGFYGRYDNDANNDGTTGDGNPLVTTGADANADGRPETYTRGDADSDRILNIWDLDADNDGLADLVEAGGTDTNGDGVVDEFNRTTGVFSGAAADADRDGFSNILDGDTDNNGTAGQGNPLVMSGTDGNADGRPDTYTSGDADNDRILNFLDRDSDNDGLADIFEAGGTDTNGDGVVDEFNQATGTFTGLGADADNDGYSNILDGDSDNNGTAGQGNPLFVTGADADVNGRPDTYPGSSDNDNDRILNFWDRDSDNDGIADVIEAGGTDSNGDGVVDEFNQATGAFTGTGADTDGDGYTNILDGDTDNNGTVGQGNPLMLTGADANNNGRPDSYPGTMDADNDDVLNIWDLDSDNDGIPDVVEGGGADTDGDGYIDAYNRTTGVFTVGGDADQDGFANTVDADTDNNGTAGDATALVTSSTDANSDGRPETYTTGNPDGDSFLNIWDLDSDNDGIADIREAGGTDANLDGRVDNYNFGTGLFSGAGDADADGYSGLVDGDANNDGTAENTVAALHITGADGNSNGRPDTYPNDNTDGNGLPNFLDLDSDDDGITDVVEANGGAVSGGTFTDNPGGGVLDGMAGTVFTDANANGWLDVSEVRTPVDTDGDGVLDYLDIDADNDGIIDVMEGVCTGCLGIAGFPAATDTDGDGIVNVFEGITAANAVAGANQGVTPNEDNDDTVAPADYLDTDSDNDLANDWTEGFDLDNDGMALHDILAMAAAYEAANGNPGHYPAPNAVNDPEADGIPAWLDNQAATGGYVEATRPPFLTVGNAAYRDVNGNGLVDIFDPAVNGVLAPTPDNDPGNDADWRDAGTFIPLPLDVIELTGEWVGEIAALKWNTLNEHNIATLNLERADSPTGTYTTVSTHAGQNLPTAQYQSNDANALNLNFYRVRVTDFDGTETFSNVVELRRDASTPATGTLTLGPNPTDNVLNVTVPGDGPYTWTMIDAAGRTVAQGTSGVSVFSLQLQGRVASGTYMFQVRNQNGSVFNQRIVVQ